METYLQYILAQINDWLKFAEAKNGALVAAAIAIIIGLLQANVSPGSCPANLDFLPLCKWYYVTTLPLWIAAGGVVALSSFLPQTAIPYVFSKPIQKSDNLLFFGEIANY